MAKLTGAEGDLMDEPYRFGWIEFCALRDEERHRQKIRESELRRLDCLRLLQSSKGHLDPKIHQQIKEIESNAEVS